MNTSTFANKLFFGIVLVLATTAFAAEKGSMKLIQPAFVGGIQLAPGEYNLSWQENGSNIELKVAKGNKVVATTSAKTVDLKNAASANGTETKQNAEGKAAVSQIFFRGKTQALEIATENSGDQSIAEKK